MVRSSAGRRCFPMRLAGERGLGLIVILMLSAALVAGGTAVTLGTISRHKNVVRVQDMRQALWLAEAGAAAAKAQLLAVPTWRTGFNNVSFKGGTYTVTAATGASPSLINVTSTGTISGESSTITAVFNKGYPDIYEYAIFSIGNIGISGSSQVVGGPIYADGNINISKEDAVVGGDVLATGNVDFASGNSSVRNGSVFANGNINLTTQSKIRVNGGNATAGGNISGNLSNVTGTTSQLVSPAPVMASTYYQTNFRIPDSQFDSYRTQAQSNGTLISGNATQADLVGLSGVVYIDGNLDLSGNYVAPADTYIVVSGNMSVAGTPSLGGPGLTVVVSGNCSLAGNPTITGVLYCDGNANATGSVDVVGNVISFGNVMTTGNLTITYQAPTSTFLYGPITLTLVSWRVQ